MSTISSVISTTSSSTSGNNNNVGVYSNMIYLDTVLYIVAGVCGIILLASFLWFFILYKIGKFSDNPRYKRHQYLQSKYRSVSPDKNIIRSFASNSKHYGTADDQPQQETTLSNVADFDKEVLATPVRKQQHRTKKISRDYNNRDLLFSVRSQLAPQQVWLDAGGAAGASNPVEVSDECSPSESYYTAHSVYVTPTQPVINGDIFFRPCREKLDDFYDTPTSPSKMDLPLQPILASARKHNY